MSTRWVSRVFSPKNLKNKFHPLARILASSKVQKNQPNTRRTAIKVSPLGAENRVGNDAIGNRQRAAGRAQGMGVEVFVSPPRRTRSASFRSLRIISPAGLEELIVKHTRDEFHYLKISDVETSGT